MQITIQSVKSFGKVSTAATSAGALKFWSSAKFAGEVVAGAAAEVTTETKQGAPKDGGGNWPDETWIVSWKAQPVQGGDATATPGNSPSQLRAGLETRELSIMAQVSLKCAVEDSHGTKTAAEIAADAETFFECIVGLVKRVQ